jgi:hypothetical protein
VDIHVVTLEGFHERFGHAVGLRGAHGREAGYESQARGKVDGLVGTVGAAVVGEPLDRMRGGSAAEAPLHRFEQQIADHLAADAGGTRAPGHELPIAGVEREGHPQYLSVPAGDLEAVRSPAFGRIVTILPS